MATWQFDGLIVPRNIFSEKFRVLPNEIDMEEFGSVDWWSRTNISKSFIRDVIPLAMVGNGEIIPGVETWGQENGNRIDVLYSKENRVVEISVRIDARDVSEEFIIELMIFLNKLDCLMICENGLVLDPHRNVGSALLSMLNQINKSNAKKFVDSPEDFFKQIDEDTRTESDEEG